MIAVADRETTLGNVPGIKIMVDTKEIDLSSYRTAFEAVHNRKLAMTDDELIYMIASLDAEEYGWDELVPHMLTVEANVAKANQLEQSKGVAISSAATDLATKAGKNAELVAAAWSYLKADETKKRGAAAFLILLQKAFTPEELATIPIVGSEGGNNPDLFKVPGQAQKGSYVRKFAEGLPPGREIQAEIDKVKAIAGKDSNKDTKEKMLQGRKNNLVKLCRDAFRIMQKMKAINDLTDAIAKFNMISDGKGGEELSPVYPILVEQKGKPSTYRIMNNSDFLSLVPAAGQSFDKLMATGGRETPDPKDKEDAKIMTIDNATVRLGELAQFFMDMYDNGKLVGAFYEKFNAPAEESDALVLSTWEVVKFGEHIKPKIQKRALALLAAQEQAEKDKLAGNVKDAA